jgi:hypothetical protein
MRLGERVVGRLAICVAALAFVAGCRQGPSRIAAPSWDPDGFADAVLAKLDKNSDGAVDMTEVAAAPGLAKGAVHIDTDKNKSLSRDELVARFQMYRDMRLGLASRSMLVSYKGRPLGGAKVTFVPEFFLEGLVEPASGETFADGSITPQTEGMDVPGLRAGYYRVVVDAPSAKLPSKYSSAETTTAGIEISPVSDGADSYARAHIALTD